MTGGSRRTQRRPWAHPSHRAEVLEGLLADRKTLSPKFLYDEYGAQLFERICELPEYYLSRSEMEILRTHAGDIAALAGPRCALIEYGSGAGVKVRPLLDALDDPASYTPVDISARQLTAVAASLARDYPNVIVHPVCADYTLPFELPRLPRHERRIAFFPGSTIGNFHPVQAIAFLQHVRQSVGARGALVLGVDRRKDVSVLHAAYNDAAGVTAEFNLNVLRRLNRELDADFDLGSFEHVAFFDEEASRIEMHLESLRSQVVCVAGERIAFERGETIWTESSYKYDDERLDALVTAAGFRVQRLWTDASERFWVAFLTADSSSGGCR
jgi:dimethylhistidine N-methyltransferase